MQFQVPQFIEVEDTIFGPLTFKQFLYLAGGAGLGFLFYVILPIYIAIFPIAAVVGLAIAMAFYKYNGRNFVFILESAVKYLVAKKLYLWKQSTNVKSNTATLASQKVSSGQPEGVPLPRLSSSKLKDLTWSLDVPINNQNNENETI